MILMSERRLLLKCFILLTSLTVVALIVFHGYYSFGNIAQLNPSHTSSSDTSNGHHHSRFYQDSLIPRNNDNRVVRLLSNSANSDNGQLLPAVHSDGETFSSEDLVRAYNFHTENKDDVLVFLHMQKTGGTTFGRHLVHDAIVHSPCKCYKQRKRCDCINSHGHLWLFSRYSTGWACGLHADWTELQACVPEMLDDWEQLNRPRRYLYFTILRDPISRYLSEWKHVQRGSTWKSAKLMCNGRRASLEELPFCFHGENWKGVTIDEFMSCSQNLAHNRQTRMLANLSLIGCYNDSFIADRAQRDRIMLRSAKENLREMAFFSLTEYQAETQKLFERTFHGIRFSRKFTQFENTHASKVTITDVQRKALEQRNALDIELYRYARELFLARLKHARISDLPTVFGSNSIVEGIDNGEVDRARNKRIDYRYGNSDNEEQRRTDERMVEEEEELEGEEDEDEGEDGEKLEHSHNSDRLKVEQKK